MQLHAEASIDIPRPLEETFDFATDGGRFKDTMKKRGLIPGVLAVEYLDGARPAAGARRRVSLSDKTAVVEEVLALTRPREHRYRWHAERAPLKLLVRSGEGTWTFSPAPGGGTRVEWRYVFTLTTPLVWPLVRILVGQFRGWMRQTLMATRAAMVAS